MRTTINLHDHPQAEVKLLARQSDEILLEILRG
jgi:hypothetical protein